jgi:hypothetical protein
MKKGFVRVCRIFCEGIAISLRSGDKQIELAFSLAFTLEVSLACRKVNCSLNRRRCCFMLGLVRSLVFSENVL